MAASETLVGPLAGVPEESPRPEKRNDELDWVLQSIGEGVIVSDDRGKIVLANPLGRDLSEVAATSPSPDPVFGVFELDGRTPLTSDWLPLARAIRGIATDDLDVIVRNARHPEGVVVSVVGRPVRDAHGSIRGGVLAFRDVTAVRRNERALAEETAKLVRANEELRVARAMAERESRFKSKFLANMSHELRTPLNAIIGFSELLLKQAFGTLNAKQKDYVTNVLSSGRHLLHIVNDVLDLSKIEAGRMTLTREWVSLSLVVDSVYRSIAPLAIQKSIELTIDVREDLPDVYIDPVRVKQVLYNLISNAIKFTPTGGRVVVRAKEVDDRIELSVEDTGVGLSDEDIGRLFQEFEQIDLPTRARPEGTGLGLALTKRLVELHGGTVSVRSAPGVGSTFTVALPSTGAAARKDTDLSGLGAIEAKHGEAQVLVVEDDPHAAELIAQHLRSAGLSVAFATNGEEAIRMAAELQPRAITLDLLLPGVDGHGVLERLKANPATARIPVVVVSVVDERHGTLVLGAADYLIKPVSADALVRSLEGIGVPLARVTGQRVLVAGAAPECDRVAELLRQAGCEVERCAELSVDAASRDGGVDVVVFDWASVGLEGAALEAVLAELSNRSIPVVSMLGSSRSDGGARGVSAITRADALKPERLVRAVHDAIDLAMSDLLWDTATGLPSQQTLLAFLRTAVQQAEREFKRIAVFTCRVSFPRHGASRPWTERLRRSFRAGDFFARAGEHRLALVAMGASEDAATAIANRLPSVLRERLHVEAGGVTVAWFPSDGRTAETLLERAMED
jgi:signal transduction histidine kinase/CheY-like chemotaxis protein